MQRSKGKGQAARLEWFKQKPELHRQVEGIIVHYLNRLLTFIHSGSLYVRKVLSHDCASTDQFTIYNKRKLQEARPLHGPLLSGVSHPERQPRRL